MSKYGGGLLLLFVAAAFCCGCVGGDSIFSGGHSQTFGSDISDERSVGVTLDEALADLGASQNEEMISFHNQSFLAVRGIQMTGDGRALSWALFVRPENEDRTVVLIYTDRGWSEYDWSRTIPYLPVDPADILSPDELLRLHEDELSGYFSAPGTEADIFLSNGTYVATVYGSDLYETFRFDAYTGEWMQ
ncbi:hypothetical protein L1S32_11500 [Methanogenium sp. S4BF]|uniref:hypothetical protein n=1 Tax=Methanogenium sp. S4BF TaxID=1789226 RepID=UPI002416B604|nr:hypothetical protein [Methanogenium sp. S4BF]WFN34447.1 hypothetical protein L1S32_11500 [Methanogenium sp. S4BF]